MSDYSQDDLNAFFKRKLDDASPDENMWNIPPDFVFDNAINKVNSSNQNQKESNKKWLLLLLIPFLILSVLFSLSYIKVNRLSDQLTTMQSDIETEKSKVVNLQNEVKKHEVERQEKTFLNNLTQDSQEKNAEKSDSKLISSNINSIKKSNNQSQVKKQLNKDLKANSYTQKYSYKNSNILSDHTIPVNNNADQIPTNILVTKVFDDGLFSESKFSGYEILEDIPEILRNSNIANLQIDRQEFALNDPKIEVGNTISNEAFDQSLRYGILLNQNMSSLSMNKMPSKFDLSHYDSSYTGIGLSVQAEKSISAKWDMQFALGYNVINNKSELNKLSHYDKSNEIEMPNGNMNYAMDLDIETPFGMVNTATDFKVDASATHDKDEIDQLTQTNQKLNILSFSIGPKYKWFENRQWELFSSAALSYNRILHYENDMNTLILMNNEEMISFRSTPPKINDINKNFLSVQLGIGVGFTISERMQFILAANYSKSLNSLRVAKSSADPSTHLIKWNSQIGLNYKF